VIQHRRFAPFLALASILLLSLIPVAPAQSAAAPWTPPHVERIFGGPSRPGVAAWGLAFNPVTGEMLVGDYISSQVRRFTLDGEWIADLSNPELAISGVVSALAVEPRDGSTYVAVLGAAGSRDVRKYDADGNYLYAVDIAGNVAWLAVDEQGDVWIPGAFNGPRIHEYRFDDASKSATDLRSVGTIGSGPGQLGRLTGIDVDADGNVYVCDAGNGTVHVFGQNGAWRFDVGTKALFPGDMRGVVVDDDAGRLYVANSQKGTIEVFDLTGHHLSTMGGPGHGDGRFLDGPRQLTVTPDGHVWGADYAARRVEELTASGAFVSSFPDPPQPPDPAGLAVARGVAVDRANGDILVADNWNQRVQRFSSGGALLTVFGERGSFPPTGMNYPRSLAVDPATRNVWVANYEGDPDLMVYTPAFQQVRRIQTPRFVNDIEIAGGRAYVVVRHNALDDGSVLIYDTSTGALLGTCCTDPLSYLRGIAVDQETGNMWLTSDTSNRVFVVSEAGRLLRTLTMPGRAWGATIVGDVVYVADVVAHQVVAFDRSTYAMLGAFGTNGTLPDQMISPSGIDHDAAGNLYVVDADAARVQRFGWSALPASETVKPTVALDAPPASAPLRLRGTAADDTKVLQVEVQVRDPATGRYWNARATTWTTSVTWNRAVVWGGLAHPKWRFTLVPTVAGRTYAVKARARDVFGNVSAARSGSFSAGLTRKGCVPHLLSGYNSHTGGGAT
jgi:DNA-binding beta-propeller fold protein YncE